MICPMEFFISVSYRDILAYRQGGKLWGGRFTGSVDHVMEAFNESFSYDQRMWKEDIQVRFLIRRNYLTGNFTYVASFSYNYQ